MQGVQFDINVITGGSNGAIESIVGGLGEITGQLNVLNRNFIGFAQQSTSGLGQVNKQVQETESGFTKLGKAAFGLNNINQALTGITNDLNAAVEPGIKFNDTLMDAKAITGATDEQMQKISASARQLAKDYGVDASGAVDAYKVALSKLGPELAKTPEILDKMGRDAVVLSKQMGGDVAGAMNVLTTAMNQYGVSIDNPIKAQQAMGAMMNIMSAGAQVGSQELPQLKSALEASGMIAKTANVSFAELNAVLQSLDKSGEGAEKGGVAVRNALSIMGEGAMMHREAFNVLKAAGVDVMGLGDKTKTFTERLTLLNPVMNDVAVMGAVFGRENVAAGLALVQNTTRIDDYHKKVVNTTSATDMATIKMSSWQEQMNRTSAKIKDMGISLANATHQYLPFINMGMGALQVMANLGMAANLFSMFSLPKMISGIGTSIASMVTWIGTTVTATAAQWGLNIALSANPVGLIVIGIAALAAGLVIAYQKSETFRAAIAGIMEVGKELGKLFMGVGKTIIGALTFNPAMFSEGLKQTSQSVTDILGGSVSKAFSKGFDESMSESKKKAAMEAASKSVVGDIAGKVDVVIPGITSKGEVAKGGVLQGYDPHKKKGKEGSELASNITAGGRRPTTIHLTIQKVIGIGEMKTTNFVGSAKEAGKQVVEEVLMALQSVNGKVSME